MKNNKGFAPVLILVAVLAVLAVGGIAYYAGTKNNSVPQNIPENNVGGDMVVKVYFAPQNSEQLECNDVAAVERTVPKTAKVGTVALEELLKGPTAEEKVKGYFTAIPFGSKLNSLTIVNGEARADFNDITESGGGSCSMGVRTTQILQTLLQFPTVKTVSISINGRTKDIFQP
ncbi:MAG: GerMN domain-containing protein [bacterium]